MLKLINEINPLLKHELIEAFQEDNKHLDFVVVALKELHKD